MRTLATLIVLLAISGCSALPDEAQSPSRRTDVPSPSSPADAAARRAGAVTGDHTGRQIAQFALTMVGTPYRYGGESPGTGFDCSGLVFYSFSQTGIAVPRTSREQFSSARKIALRDAGEGDLLFFSDQEKLSHVGIYLGDGRFVHAPSSGRTVSVAELDHPWYQQHLVGVGRLLND